jgi:hypothetical protein
MKHVDDMRIMMSEEIAKIREGNSTPANINAIVNATGKYLQTIKMEIEYNKLLGKIPKIEFFARD